MLIVLALLACDTKEPPIDDTADTGDSGDTGTDSGDSGDSGDTGPTEDVEGPALPDCTPQAGSGDLVALSGVVLAPSGPVAGHVVYSRASGEIECAGADCDTDGAEIVCTEGLVSPGLIDAHNHLQYNTLPPWQVGPEFEDRYDWQDDDRYDDYRTAYDEIKDDYKCEIMKWAELRELVHGTTSAVGSSGDDCIELLVRNLDEDEGAHGLDGYSLQYNSGRVSSLDEGDAEDAAADLASGALDAMFNHVAEGKDGSVTDEIDYMSEIGMVGPGQAFVHTTDATLEQLAQMAADGTAIVWSPRSNLALYDTTTPVVVADRLGVPWAIGTDWTPSGSMAPIEELSCAADWLDAKGAPVSDVDLYDKATLDAAAILGVDGQLGALEAGYRADISVFAWDAHPYRKVIEARPEDVRLVIVDGAALYGTTDLVNTLAETPGWCEAMDVCGEARSVCLKAADSGDDAQTVEDVEDTLNAAMAGTEMPSGYEYAGELYGLFTCEAPTTCDPREPSSGDDDGDGVDDASDVCAGVYDPYQLDGDGDGEGDDCDPCPMEPDVTECASTAGDLDGDGVPNEDDVCPRVADDQADADNDGIGDACDACPDEPNVDGAGCTTTVTALRDASDPEHPADGTRVHVEGLVVTGVRPEHGFFVQDPALSEFGGLYVYDFGDNAVSVGDILTIDGTYTEYYELTELTEPTVTVTGSSDVPTPLAADPCDVATGGSLAEPYESMLVSVGAVDVTNANPDDPSDYDEFEVADCLRVDDFLWEELDQPEVGTSYDGMVGVLTYSFSNSKLLPRSEDDLR